MSETSIEATGAETASGGTQSEATSWKAPESQADLDRIINIATAKLHKRYEGYDELKAKAEKWDQLEDEKKTPSEKAIEEARATATGETAAKFEQRIASTEVKALAATRGFLDPADALTVLTSDIPKKDDDIDTDELKKRVEKLATDKPYLVKEPSRTPRTRPQPRPGEKQQDTTGKPGSGKAAAALRQLGADRRSK